MVKQFISSHYKIENTFNKDKINQPSHSEIRPDQSSLQNKIMDKCKRICGYTNLDPNDHSNIEDDTYYYLGLSLHKSTDSLSLKSKPIYLKTKISSSVDITIRNMTELKNFLTYKAGGSLIKAHLAALVNSSYCPTHTLNSGFKQGLQK